MFVLDIQYSSCSAERCKTLARDIDRISPSSPLKLTFGTCPCLFSVFGLLVLFATAFSSGTAPIISDALAIHAEGLIMSRKPNTITMILRLSPFSTENVDLLGHWYSSLGIALQKGIMQDMRMPGCGIATHGHIPACVHWSGKNHGYILTVQKTIARVYQIHV